MDETIGNPQENADDQLAKAAYSVGFILGDGYLQSYSAVKNGKRYPLQVVRIGKPDLDSIERVRKEISDVFDADYAIMPRKLASGIEFFQLHAYRRDIFEFFAVNTAYKAKIPDYYFTAPGNVKRDLLAGLMDSDGWISERETRWEVGFGMTNLSIVAGCASIMKSLGVKVGKIGEYTKGEYRVIHRIQPNIRSFAESGCYFHCERKRQKLANCIARLHASETTNAAPST